MLAYHFEVGVLARLPIDEVECHPCSEARRTDSEAGVSTNPGQVASVRSAPGRSELRCCGYRSAPAMGEDHTFELWERLEEVLCEDLVRAPGLVILFANSISEAVYGVVPAPQDPVVRRESVIVELVADISEALPTRPTKRFHLFRGQWLCHEHIVVDGDDEPSHPCYWTSIGVRRDNHLRCPNRTSCCCDDESAAGFFDVAHGAVVIHDDTKLLSDPAKAPRQAGRIDDRRTVWQVQASKVRWRLHSGAHCLAIKDHRVLVVTAMYCLCFLDLIDVPLLGGNADEPGLLETDIEIVVVDEVDDRPEVLLAEALEPFELRWPV